MCTKHRQSIVARTNFSDKRVSGADSVRRSLDCSVPHIATMVTKLSLPNAILQCTASHYHMPRAQQCVIHVLHNPEQCQDRMNPRLVRNTYITCLPGHTTRSGILPIFPVLRAKSSLQVCPAKDQQIVTLSIIRNSIAHTDNSPQHDNKPKITQQECKGILKPISIQLKKSDLLFRVSLGQHFMAHKMIK